MYRIEGYVETISSDGKFTIHGTDGYYLEREDLDSNGKKEKKQYNVFWMFESFEGSCQSKVVEPFDLFTYYQDKMILQLPQDGQQREFQLLTAAKVNHQKVRVELNGAFDKTQYKGLDPVVIENVTLLK